MSRRGSRRWDSFATRLMVAQLGVLSVSVLTATGVAVLVGPRVFHAHLRQAGGLLSEEQVLHAERAYLDSSLVAVGVALLIAIGSASVVTWLIARRLRRPLKELASAARAIESGRYDRRVAPTGAGAELDEFAAAFNTMVTRLEITEDTRRRLLTDLAHEMRTPVATCTAYLEALDDEVARWGPETSAVMSQQVARLARLAADIDDVSRAEEGRLAIEPRPVPMGRIIGSSVDSSRARFADRGVHIELDDSPAAAAAVRVDAQRLGQVFANVLDNAVRHSAPGGRVSIRSRVESGEVVVEVVDDGDGIPAEQLPHVFERFYRGDSARDRTPDRGSGIGLTISRAIVEAHGGSLTARSAGRGHGATFEVRLPVCTTGAAEVLGRDPGVAVAKGMQ